MDYSNCVLQLKNRLMNGAWVNPRGDSNGLYKTVKVTKESGVINVLRLPYGKIDMPVTGRLFVVVELGFTPTQLLSIQQTPDWWIPIKDLYLNNHIQIQGTTQGRLLTLEHGYIRFERNHNVLIAIDYEYNQRSLNLHSDIYYRFYHCESYDLAQFGYTGTSHNGTRQYTPIYQSYKKLGTTPADETDFNTFISSIGYVGTGEGYSGTVALYYVNGLLWTIESGGSFPNTPLFTDLTVGDIVEGFVEPTFGDTGGVYSLKIEDLRPYWSDADNQNKVILSLDVHNDTVLDKSIFLDDCEFFIVRNFSYYDGAGPTKYAGQARLLPRYYPSTFRHLTYKEIGISSEAITNAINELKAFKDLRPLSGNTILTETFYLMILRHQNGQYREMVQDSHCLADLRNIDEAYDASVPTNTRVRTLTGVDSVFPIWLANNLETSPYNTWIDLPTKDVATASLVEVCHRNKTKELLQDVYIKPLNVAYTDFNDPSGFPVYYPNQYSMPPLATPNGCVLLQLTHSQIPLAYNGVGGNGLEEYPPADYSGTLFTTAWDAITFITYPQQDVNSNLDTVILANDTSNTTIDTTLGIFCYYLKSGVLTVAVYNVDYTFTETSTSTIITWAPGITVYERYVRRADRYIRQEVSLTNDCFTNGISLYGTRAHVNAVGMEHLLVMFRGDAGYFGHAIEGLDFVVKDLVLYPISSLFVPGFSCLILYSGLPNESLLHENKTQYDFIKNYRAFNNGKYDLLNDRHLLLSINHTLTTPEKVIYQNMLTEGYSDNTSTLPADSGSLIIEAKPCAFLAKPNFIKRETLDLLGLTEQQTQLRDQEVANYLNFVKPQLPPTGYVLMAETYQLISPLMNALIYDISHGIFPTITETSYTDLQVEQMVSLYLHYLAIDPCMLTIDQQFTRIDPVWVEMVNIAGSIPVTARDYAFVEHVNQYILNNRVGNLNLFLSITGP